jgi:hypothetical protein
MAAKFIISTTAGSPNIYEAIKRHLKRVPAGNVVSTRRYPARVFSNQQPISSPVL